MAIGVLEFGPSLNDYPNVEQSLIVTRIHRDARRAS